MIWVKTERGRALLCDRRALSPRERQLLVLADGRRSTAELGRWLGFSVEPVLDQLVQGGYLERARGNLGSAAKPPDRAAAQPTRTMALVAPPIASAAVPVPGASASRAGSRRSLAASKMYVVSLMQMLRDADAASLAVSLHGAQGPEDLVEVLAASLAYLNQRSGPEYATRVAGRLLEVIPQAHLPALCAALAATGAPALIAVADAQRPPPERMWAPLTERAAQPARALP
ncbi:MAG: hypothetical protein KA914_07810 [Ottowia sp.]|nr:hypothetical protein [Ottowia sp.]